MKLIYSPEGTPDNYLFNCTRNSACQDPYFIPVPSFGGLMQFYTDLFGSLNAIGITAVMCTGEEVPVIAQTSISGTKPDGTYYVVLGDLLADRDILPGECFYLRFEADTTDGTAFYFSQYFCVENCKVVNTLRGCYPNEPIGYEAFDCNGIYYGFPNDTEDMSYRYFHWAFVREGQIIEQKKTLAISLFNSRKAYKSTLQREKVFEFELVPTFYSDVLIAVFGRGNIEIDGTGYLVAEQNEFSISDKDSKLWPMDVLLGQECKLYFGCGQSDCELPEPSPDECCSPTDPEATIESTEGEEAQCCSPDVDEVSLEVGEPICCTPNNVSATSQILGEFIITETIIVEDTNLASLSLISAPSQTGIIVWGDGTSETFDSGLTGVFGLIHSFNSGSFIIKLYFDVNSFLVYQSIWSEKVTSFFTHTDNFTNIVLVGLSGILDLNDVLPPPASNINALILVGSPSSVQTSMDFSSLVSSVQQMSISTFPLLASVTNLPATLISTIGFDSNAELVDIDSGGTISSSTIAMTGNKDGLAIPTIDYITIPVQSIRLKQDFNTAFVNAVLAGLVAGGFPGGFADLQQIPTAPPSGAGIIDKATLISNGWTVNTD